MSLKTTGRTEKLHIAHFQTRIICSKIDKRHRQLSRENNYIWLSNEQRNRNDEGAKKMHHAPPTSMRIRANSY